MTGSRNLVYRFVRGLHAGHVPRRVVGALGGDHHGDAGRLHNAGVIGADRLPLDDRRPRELFYLLRWCAGSGGAGQFTRRGEQGASV